MVKINLAGDGGSEILQVSRTNALKFVLNKKINLVGNISNIS